MSLSVDRTELVFGWEVIPVYSHTVRTHVVVLYSAYSWLVRVYRVPRTTCSCTHLELADLRSSSITEQWNCTYWDASTLHRQREDLSQLPAVAGHELPLLLVQEEDQVLLHLLVLRQGPSSAGLVQWKVGWSSHQIRSRAQDHI